MSLSLVIDKFNSPRRNLRNPADPLTYGLFVRERGPIDTDYYYQIGLTEKQAHAIAGEHTDIYFRHNRSHDLTREPQDLVIKRVQDRKPKQLAWTLEIGGEEAGYVGDDLVRYLIDLSHPVFEPNEPNWKTRDIERIDDAIADHRSSIEDLEERKAAMLAEMEGETPSP